MKKIAAFATILLIFNFKCIAQDMVTQNRPVANFKEIRIGSGIDLYLKQGNTEKLELTAPKDKIGKIITEVHNGVLEIHMEYNNWNWNWGGAFKSSPKVHLSFKDLKAIKASGGSDVFSEGRLLFENILIDASGGSDIKLAITAESVECETSGGSDTILSGSTKYFKCNSSGGSDLKAKDLRSQYCKVSSSGGSDAYVWAESELLANASGGSDIYYYGSPKNVKINKSGGADVNRR
jgi:Putative auto-transporter adhesin, head GIN domain